VHLHLILQNTAFSGFNQFLARLIFDSRYFLIAQPQVVDAEV